MNGMKRRKRIGALNAGGIGSTLINQALPVAVGFLAGKLLTKNISFLSSNPTMGNVVKIAGGALLAGQGGMLAGVGVGIAADGVASFAGPVFNISGMGLLPPGNPSRYVAGTPGAGMGLVVPTGDAVNVTF